MAANTKTDICNRALQLVFLTPKFMNVEDDKSPEADACNGAYDEILDDLLYGHPWNFAMARAQIGASGVPAFRWLSEYPLPQGPAPPFCLRVWELDQESHPRADWIVEGRKLLTDETGALNIIYISRVTNVADMSPGFRAALALKIAADIAPNVTNSTTLGDKLEDRLIKVVLARAKAADGQEEGNFEQDQGEFLEARR